MLTRMMKWLVSKLGYILYTCLIVLFSLWLLFPATTFKQWAVGRLNKAYPAMDWRLGSISWNFPAEVVVRGLEGHNPKGRDQLLVRVESLAIRPDLLDMIKQRRLHAAYALAFAKGHINGEVELNRDRGIVEVKGTVDGFDLGEQVMLKRLTGREIKGVYSGPLTLTILTASRRLSALQAEVKLKNGVVALKQAVLGHQTIPYDQVTCDVHSEGTQIVLEKGTVKSPLFFGEFSGKLLTHQDPLLSLLTIHGKLQPHTAFFKNVGSKKALQAIRKRLKGKPVPLEISGTLSDPGIQFGEFSMLFDALQKEYK